MNHPQTTFRTTTTDRHVERLDHETLVYDVASDQVHRLAPVATRVWDACGDGATVEAIQAATGIDPQQVDRAIAELGAAGLVEPTDAISRRQFTVQVGAGMAAAAGLALVSTMAAPTPAAAQSAGNGGSGNGGGGHNGDGNGGNN